MRSVFLFILAAAFLSGTGSVLGQSEQISDAEYNTALATALHNASSHNRRVLTDETFYTGSQVTGTRRIVSDFAGKDARKIEVVEEFGGKKSKSGSVMIGEQFFCREGDKGWKRANKECAKKGGAMAVPDGDYEYFVEPDPNNYGRKVYTRRANYTDAGSPERDAARLKFIEIKFVTDETGAIVEYTETRRGGNEPSGWSSKQVTVYDYQPRNLQIVDPTKVN